MVVNFRFNVGDILEIENTFNKKSIFIRIESKYYVNWLQNVSGNYSNYDLDDRQYTVTVQYNSFCNNIEETPFRPGTCLIYYEMELENAKKILDFHLPIVEKDTLENIQRRKDIWEYIKDKPCYIFEELY